jgi:hypothetical protein
LSSSQKRTHERRASPTRGVTYDPLEFLESTVEMPNTRRRTIDYKDIMQGHGSRTETRRMPPMRDYDNFDQNSSADASLWKDKERQYIREKMDMEGRLNDVSENIQYLIICLLIISNVV